MLKKSDRENKRALVVALFDYFSIRLWSFSFSSFAVANQPAKQYHQQELGFRRPKPKAEKPTVCSWLPESRDRLEGPRLQ